MAYIKVDLNKLQNLKSDLQGTSTGVASVQNIICSVRRNLDWDVSCENNIERTLQRISSDLDKVKSRYNKSVDFLSYAFQEYSKVEYDNNKAFGKNNIQRIDFSRIQADVSYAGDVLTVDNNRSKASSILNRQDTAKSVLSNFGPIGKVLSVLTEPTANWLKYGKFEFGKAEDSSAMKWAKFGKGAVKCLGTVSSFQKTFKKADLISRFNNTGSQYLFGSQHADYKFKNLLGLNKVDLRSTLGDNAYGGKSARGWDSFKTNVDVGFKHNFKSTFIKSDGSINKLGIAGVVLDLGIKGIENWNDYKSGNITSVDRVVVETVTETAFDIALTAGATTVISAGLLAVGVVSAPAIAVGAVAGLAVAGINGLTKAITGSTLTQHVGTLAGDVWDKGKEVVENIAEGGGGAVKKGAEIIESAKEKMSSLGNKISKKTKAIFSASKLKPAWL